MKTTIQYLKSMCYMGHKVLDKAGRKISYWRLRDMDNKEVIVSISVSLTDKINNIYQLI